jgi:4-amino-4-deoxy-L-arabinose transferase-like glycosyltransferase
VRRELLLVGVAAALGLAIRLGYVAATGDHVLAGDEIEYDIEGRLIAAGNWFWTTTPYGVAHESIWKAPGYPAWVGVWYSLLGQDPDRVLLVQTLLGPVTILFTWLLARRLFGPRVAIAAAFLVALHPFAWLADARLFPESLATPLTLGVLLLVLDREPSARRAGAAGALIGLLALVRPSSLWLLAGAVTALAMGGERRRALAAAALCVGVALLVVAPWTYRNHEVAGAFVPISLQDSALYGVFNDDAANDHKHPWEWRAVTARDRPLFDRRNPLPDAELRSRLRENALDFIGDHPESLPKAFFWNGLSRLWEVRRPGYVLDEASAQGRSRAGTGVGLVLHYVLLPLAVVGLWRARRRVRLVVPLLVMALGASVIHTADSGTRYRAPFEPLIVTLACSSLRRLDASGSNSSSGAHGRGRSSAYSQPR